jgi:molybdopterin/thiamine biosynthesis adenylyltransferase
MRNDRTLRYAQRVLDPARRIVITGQTDYLQSPSGQSAAAVTANLLSRMTPNVTLGFEDISIQFAGADDGRSLHEHLLNEMRAADPKGFFAVRNFEEGDYRLHLGSDGAKWVVHGSKWNAFVGEAPSSLVDAKTANPLGGAFAAIVAVAQIFKGPFPADVPATVVNAFNWNCGREETDCWLKSDHFLGHLWFVGAGSVGSAIAYFLTMAGAKFEATIFDGDRVKVENLDRSPIFSYEDVGKPKAEVLAEFLRARGISAIGEPVWLDQSEKWKQRQQGVPDLLVSAANERDVRYLIETLLPPVQIYGTTGANWQASVLRHIPPQDPCSCCVFPPGAPASTKCAEGVVSLPTSTSGEEKKVDASLPFLSFAAGLMAAAEIVKLNIGSIGASNRAFFVPCADEMMYSAPLGRSPGCLCGTRSSNAHRAMIAGSKYAKLSTFSHG